MNTYTRINIQLYSFFHFKNILDFLLENQVNPKLKHLKSIWPIMEKITTNQIHDITITWPDQQVWVKSGYLTRRKTLGQIGFIYFFIVGQVWIILTLIVSDWILSLTVWFWINLIFQKKDQTVLSLGKTCSWTWMSIYISIFKLKIYNRY